MGDLRKAIVGLGNIGVICRSRVVIWDLRVKGCDGGYVFLIVCVVNYNMFLWKFFFIFEVWVRKGGLFIFCELKICYDIKNIEKKSK